MTLQRSHSRKGERKQQQIGESALSRKWYMWCSACPIFSEFLGDNEKAFLLNVWTLGKSYLNTISWIFQMEFFAHICIAPSFVLKKLNENQFFFEPVCQWLLWQLRRDSAKKLCGQHEENVGKYISSIFRITYCFYPNLLFDLNLIDH